MVIKHNDLIADSKEPFKNCKLDRKKYADVLTEIVRNYAEGFVLAINNEWGTGKTTFIKMWKQQLDNSGFKTLYFNAWENDFNEEPLVAIISELKTLLPNKANENFKKVMKNGAALTKAIVPAVINALVKEHLGDVKEEIKDIIKDTSKPSIEYFTKKIEAYADKKKNLTDFKKNIKKYVKDVSNQKPLIFFIDELDRCRPTYAVEVLEHLKHFFSVEGIVFVLSIDKEHLASSIKGFYGSENINTDEYLRRFIDLEYSIPEPNIENFVEYLYSYFSFNKFFDLRYRVKNPYLKNDGNNLKEIAGTLFIKSSATLRQMEKIISLTRVVISTFGETNMTYSSVLFYLIYLKIMLPDSFIKIHRNEFTIQQLCDEFENLMIKEEADVDNRSQIYILALLLYLYNNNSDSLDEDVLYKTDNGSKPKAIVDSKFDPQGFTLGKYLQQFSRDGKRYNTRLNYLQDKISLITSFVKDDN